MILPYVALIVSNILVVLAQLSLKKVALGISGDREQPFDVMRIGLAVLTNPALWVALVSFGMSFGLSIFILTKIDLTRAFPVSTGFGFVLIAVIAHLAYGERLSALNFLGMLLVFAGVVLLTLKNR